MRRLNLVNKIRAGAALAMVFLLIIATNMVDSNHFKVVRKSLTIVYEDRLLAKDYIYKISRQLQVKRVLMQNIDNDQLFAINSAVNDSIQSLILKYEVTKLTENELVRFESLKEKFSQLIAYENELPQGESLDREFHSLKTVQDLFMEIYNDLDFLSQIQLEESKREINHSNKTISKSNFISRLEIAALIIIGIMIQLLIFIKPLK